MTAVDARRAVPEPPPGRPSRPPADRQARREERATPTVPAPSVGRAPAVLALSSVGVLLVALAYHRGRNGGNGDAVYWAGQVVVFTPVAARMLSRRLAGQSEAFLLVLGLAVSQYLLKFMYSPNQLKFPDELQHWAATTTVVETGRLFQPNPALPVAKDFPGLEEMGAGVASLTGLPVTASALLVAGLARLVFVGGLFVLVRRAGGPPRLAGMACVIYATGQHYLFFDAMYLYQTAALPFVILAIWATCVLRRRLHLGAAVVGAVSVAVATISHHLAAVAMAGILVVLAMTARRPGPAILAGFALLTVGAWLAFPAREVVAYFEAPARKLLDSLTGVGSQAGGGPGSPRWQLAVQAVGMLVLLVLLMKAVRAALRTKNRDPWWWVALAGGLLFFAGTLLWFAGSQGPELAGRVGTFTFLPVSIVAAAELVRRNRSRRRRPRTYLAAGTAIATLLMVGARAGGWPPWWERLPGPYRVGAFERSVDLQGVVAAKWTRAWLGPGNRVAADTIGWILLASYGRQAPIAGQAAPAYYSAEFGLRDAQLMDQLSVEYVWVDLRMSEQTPASGAYFVDDPKAGRHRTPVPRSSLTKFGDLPTVNLVYDNGDIRIYDLRDL